MLKKIIILSTTMMLSILLFGCTPKKVTLDNFKLNIVEINKRTELLNRKLIPPKSILKKCKLKKKSLLALQKENHLLIDKVLRLNNTLNYAEFSYKNKKVIEKSLDNVLEILFNLRQVSKNRLSSLKDIEVNQNEEYLYDNEEYLCNLKLKPTPKIEACTDCRAVFN